jgi:drug/metabolite transporter (DMT)-like permease
MSRIVHRLTSPHDLAVPALIGVTAVWGLTFVQVKDAVAVYPLFPFLALRFAIATVVLAPFGWRRVRGLGRRGWSSAAIAGGLLAGGYTLQTLGLEHTTVSSAGFVTGMYVVLTPLIAFAVFGVRIGRVVWIGVVLATLGLALLAGVRGGGLGGEALVLAGAAVYSVQIVLMERYAPLYDVVGFTLVEMLFACLLLGVVAVPSFEVPHGWTVWGALLVTGIFASALAFLVQTWAQRRTTATQTAVVFTLEPVWAAIFGYWLAGDRLGAEAWIGCVAILAGIVLTGREETEPTVAPVADAA